MNPTLHANGYTFKPHEMPMIAGSPATPDHPAKRKIAYILISLCLTFVCGLQNGLFAASLPQWRGELGLTIEQGGWVQVGYFMGYATFGALLFKVRQHFGLQKFIRCVLWFVALANLIQLFAERVEILFPTRILLGIGTSGMFTLAVFYAMQALSGIGRILGIAIFSGLMQLVPTIAQIMIPSLYLDGDMQAVLIFQFSATLLAIGLTRWLPLPPSIKKPLLIWLDYVSFAMFAVGTALLCAFLVLGNIVWWDTPWLGVLLAAAFALLALMFWVESHRREPLIYWKWVSAKQIVLFLLIAMLTRLFTTEQSVGANAVLSLFGLSHKELMTYNLIIALASFAGLLLSIVTLKVQEIRRSTMIALLGIALGAYLDIGISNQSRAEQFYLSQSIIAFSSFYFAGPVLIEGLLRAISAGFSHIVSFIALFSMTQTLGGLLGAAGFNTYITYQSKLHLQNLSQHITATDPAITPQAVGNLIKNASLEARLLAYNDLFELIFIAAFTAGAAAFIMWIYRKIKGIDILEQEINNLKAMMKPN